MEEPCTMRGTSIVATQQHRTVPWGVTPLFEAASAGWIPPQSGLTPQRPRGRWTQPTWKNAWRASRVARTHCDVSLIHTTDHNAETQCAHAHNTCLAKWNCEHDQPEEENIVQQGCTNRFKVYTWCRVVLGLLSRCVRFFTAEFWKEFDVSYSNQFTPCSVRCNGAVRVSFQRSTGMSDVWWTHCQR